VVVDRLKPSTEEKSRLFDSIQSALKVGGGVVVVSVDNKDTMYSQRNACPHCGISLGDLEPRTFSFNSPFGACRECNGLGMKIEFDPDLIIPDKSKSIIEGAIRPWTGHFATFRSARASTTSTSHVILIADGNTADHLKGLYQTLTAFTAKPNPSQSAKT
jgi:excinuclease ABC subunit A